METCFSSGEKKKKCIHKTIKSNYLNEDFWLADSNYFDLKEMHLFFFLSEMICHCVVPVFLQYSCLELGRLEGLM